MFIYHPENWGKIFQSDEHVFQMGWFNHQPDDNDLGLSMLHDYLGPYVGGHCFS